MEYLFYIGLLAFNGIMLCYWFYVAIRDLKLKKAIYDRLADIVVLLNLRGDK